MREKEITEIQSLPIHLACDNGLHTLIPLFIERGGEDQLKEVSPFYLEVYEVIC